MRDSKRWLEMIERQRELQEDSKGTVKDHLENNRKERKTHTDLLSNYIDQTDAILKRNEAFEMATGRERDRRFETYTNMMSLKTFLISRRFFLAKVP